jgi:hypothetical protein
MAQDELRDANPTHGRNRLRQRLFVVKLDSKRIAITGKEAFSQMTMV